VADHSTRQEQRRVRIADLILRLRQAGITDQRVVAAIESVPRDVFVPADWRAEAYAERALPIDCGQMLTAPVIVAMMTAALDVGDHDRVLEVGTGTGYQTAVLAGLARRVYTIDRFRTLVAAAESRFKTLRLANVVTAVGDGMAGWPDEAPFDRIIVTAAGEEVPAALMEQVQVGGVIVMPIGPGEEVQKLTRLERDEEGFTATTLADVRFVPLIAGVAEHL